MLLFGWGFLLFVLFFDFFPEKQIVCLLDLIYYLHYSKTYMIQAESENRALFCLLTLVRASLGQENVGNRSLIRPKQTLARAGGGCETFNQQGFIFLLVVICYCSVFVMAEVSLKS